MSFPNSSITDIIATTIENRSSTIADNVTKNNALYSWLKKKGNVKPFSGGRTIFEEFSFAQNANAGWYSGYDTLPVAAQDVLSGAEFAIKQLACPVVISGLEELQNSGQEALIDLMESRLAVAEATMANLMSVGAYSDGTGTGGKQLTGLDLAVPENPATGTYGGIDRATWTFWASQYYDPGSSSASNIQAFMHTLWGKCVRGADRPDLILMDPVQWGFFSSSMNALQRFTDTSSANLGFPSMKFMDADVVLDGGIGGAATANRVYMLNTKYFKLRPHSKRNMTSLKQKSAINQDASVTTLVWAGNLTCSGAQFQGRGLFD